MTTPIIFLDFDGPLFSARAELLPENDIKYSKTPELKNILHPFISYWKMDPIAVAILNNVVDIVNAEIVISSSWRELHTKDEIQALFDVNGLSGPIHEDWCTPIGSKYDPNAMSYIVTYKNRAEEIQGWINKHPEVTQWVAVDDDESILKFEIKNRVLVEYADGIMYDHYLHMLRTLK
jgi:hypothetical protein